MKPKLNIIKIDEKYQAQSELFNSKEEAQSFIKSLKKKDKNLTRLIKPIADCTELFFDCVETDHKFETINGDLICQNCSMIMTQDEHDYYLATRKYLQTLSNS